jgi:hypothetical protein
MLCNPSTISDLQVETGDGKFQYFAVPSLSKIDHFLIKAMFISEGRSLRQPLADRQ